MQEMRYLRDFLQAISGSDLESGHFVPTFMYVTISVGRLRQPMPCEGESRAARMSNIPS